MSSHSEYQWNGHVITLTSVAWIVIFHLGAAPILIFAWTVWPILPVDLHSSDMVAFKRSRIDSFVLVLLPGHNPHHNHYYHFHHSRSPST